MAVLMIFMIQSYTVDIIPNMIFVNVLSVLILFLGYPLAQGTPKTYKIYEKILMLCVINFCCMILAIYITMTNRLYI